MKYPQNLYRQNQNLNKKINLLKDKNDSFHSTEHQPSDSGFCGSYKKQSVNFDPKCLSTCSITLSACTDDMYPVYEDQSNSFSPDQVRFNFLIFFLASKDYLKQKFTACTNNTNSIIKRC